MARTVISAPAIVKTTYVILEMEHVFLVNPDFWDHIAQEVCSFCLFCFPLHDHFFMINIKGSYFFIFVSMSLHSLRYIIALGERLSSSVEYCTMTFSFQELPGVSIWVVR